MTKYYLKMDNIMKNMFVVALNDELQAQSEQDECLEETKALLKKVRIRQRSWYLQMMQQR